MLTRVSKFTATPRSLPFTLRWVALEAENSY